jgi:hypothetical protein
VDVVVCVAEDFIMRLLFGELELHDALSESFLAAICGVGALRFQCAGVVLDFVGCVGGQCKVDRSGATVRRGLCRAGLQVYL